MTMLIIGVLMAEVLLERLSIQWVMKVIIIIIIMILFL